VRDKGILRGDGTHGDVLVMVEVAVPQQLSDEATQALRTYAEKTSDHDPRQDLYTLAGLEDKQ
jgi:molecular chaperone DnaJ